MASADQIQQLYSLIEGFDDIDMERLNRTSLGESGSLVDEIRGRLSEIETIKTLAQKYAPFVHGEYVGNAVNSLSRIRDFMQQQSSAPDVQFLSNKSSFLNQIDMEIEETRRWLPIFVSAGVLSRGLLDDEGIKRESERALVELRETATKTLDTIKDESTKAIQDAENLAKEIENRARRTASKISVQEAQRQFGEAVKTDKSRVVLWWVMAGLSFTLLIGMPLSFMAWELPKNAGWPESVYHMLLRLLVLSSVAGVAAFTLRMLRVHLHLAERNRHRVRVANSVESFVQSALEPAQRDLILARLVDSIIGFGNSGLVHNDGDDHTSPMSGDVVGRVVAAISRKDPS